MILSAHAKGLAANEMPRDILAPTITTLDDTRPHKASILRTVSAGNRRRQDTFTVGEEDMNSAPTFITSATAPITSDPTAIISLALNEPHAPDIWHAGASELTLS